MIGGDHERLFGAAKGEKDESLRREAIRQLGLVHGTSELEQLYQTETARHVRRGNLQHSSLRAIREDLQAAQGEKDANAAGGDSKPWLIHSDDSAKALQRLQQRNGPRGEDRGIERIFPTGERQGTRGHCAKRERPELKKTAVSKLTLMNSKEGTDYLMELLQK